MDDNSIRASHYLDDMDGAILSENRKSKSVKAKNSNKAKANTIPALVAWVGSGLSPENNQPYYLKYILGFVLGVLAICLVWLFVPTDKPIVLNFSKPINDSAQMKELKNENLSLNSHLNDAMDALEKAKTTEKQLQNQMDEYVKWSANLRDLQNLADDGKYKEAVTEIEKNLDGLDLPKEIEDEVIALNNTCKPLAVPQFYDSAKKIYSSNAKAKDREVYKQSADEYKMAIQIIEELQLKPSYVAEVYYYGGKAIALSQSPSKQEADTEATRCFKMVMSVAPGSKLASYAQVRVNELKAGDVMRH